MKAIFWISFFFVFYTYAGYPLLLAFISSWRKRPVRKASIFPKVSVVIAAYNEHERVEKRILELFKQDYPENLLEVVLISDGSTDGTVAVARAVLSDSKLIIVELPERVGKAVAVNAGVAAAKGEIVVFADCRQSFSIDAVRKLVENFADPGVGAATGELHLYNPGDAGLQTEMGTYWRYEKMVRKLEGLIYSVVGATGAIYAIRKSLYQNLPAGTILDDVLTPMNIVCKGYRVVFDGEARAFDVVSEDVSQEWRRKVRTLAGNWQLLQLAPHLFSPLANPIWIFFLSHKIARLLVPGALVGILVTSLAAPDELYLFVGFAQILFYLMAVAAMVVPVMCKIKILKLINFFVVLNAAAVAGFWVWASGRCGDAWAQRSQMSEGAQ